MIPKWGRIRTPKPFFGAASSGGTKIPAPSRHGLEVIVLTFLLLPEQVLSSFNEDLLYIYIVYDIVYYIYICIITVSMRTCQLATAGWKLPD